MSRMSRDEIVALEERYQLKTYSKLPIVVERGEGSWIWDADGTRYLDYYGGHCVTILGHSPPRVIEAIRDQAGRMLFYSNLVYSEIRASAAERLARMAPEGLDTVFFCNSGTEANETALKLARKMTGRRVIVAFEGDFHGRTLGSLATTWGENYRAPYANILPDTIFVPIDDQTALRDAFARDEPPAAALVEPIQSIAGMSAASPDTLRRLRELCDLAGARLIFDEVQTGVGRTGRFSVSEHLDLLPDMITLAKSLGAGVPVGAVLVNQAVAESVAFGDQGTTFGGGMLAMAAVLATLETIEADGLMARAPAIEERIRSGVRERGIDVLGMGCLLGLVVPVSAKAVLAALRARRVIAGGAGESAVIRLMPPLTTTDDEIDFFLDALNASLSEVVDNVLQDKVEVE